MADLSQIIQTVRLPVDIDIQPYLRDHCFQGTAVLPAVEAMQVLARSVQQAAPAVDIGCMTEVRLDRFLHLQPGSTKIAAVCEIARLANGDIAAALQTKHKSATTSIGRIKDHVSLRFPRIRPDVAAIPLDLAASLEGVCMEICADQIYRELIPFGPAYHSITASLYISEDGAIAAIRAPASQAGADPSGPLGSPFPLDAAFHAACVWGQRYAQTVAFPVGIDQRVICQRTQPGDTYFSRIHPVRTESDELMFNIWIYDQNGCLFEIIGGARMRDISAGRLEPPQWISASDGSPALDRIRQHCHALALIELGTVLPFADKTLSKLEQKRVQPMQARRKRNYLAARLACKRLARILSDNDTHTAAAEITTVGEDGVRPCCPPTAGSSALTCSVAHDERFAVAVASVRRAGIDVEKVSARVLKSCPVFLSAEEQTLIQASQMGQIEAAIRIWSIKEAVAKALDVPLADAWRRVRVIAVGQEQSSFLIDEKGSHSGIHASVGTHLFTLACPS
jgi:phosphopantetheinyl transferase